MTYVSPRIECLDGASLTIEDSPDNEGRPRVDHQYILTVRRDGQRHVLVPMSRVGLETLLESMHSAWFEALR